MQSTKPLIFDIGANIGGFSSLYCEDYSVVAVEANPDLVDVLYKDGRFQVESCAISCKSGTIDFHLCSQSQMSSCNKKWLTEMRYASAGISKTISVPCITLDDLIVKYGVPYHIKIDVEGYELEVVSGLSNKIMSIQFEYICEQFSSITHQTIRRLADLGYSKFSMLNCGGDFTPEAYKEHEETNTYLTADDILKIDGKELSSGMILAF